MDNYSSGDAPIVKGNKFFKSYCSKNNLEREAMKQISYASVVGSVMCAQLCPCLDIADVVSVLEWFQSNLRMDNWRLQRKL